MKIKRNNKKIITLCLMILVLVSAMPAFGLPADPENAALLYYQAFVLYEKPDETMENMVNDLAAGKIEPNARIEKYLKRCEPAIELTIKAGELSFCDWGLVYSDGIEMQMPHAGQGRNLARLVLADARTLAAKGEYDMALERCLTAQKMGRHIGAKPATIIGILVGISVDTMANESVVDMLADLPKDAASLNWLKGRLAETDDEAFSIKACLDTENEVFRAYLSKEKFGELPPLESLAIEADLVEAAQGYLLDADEEFFANNRIYWDTFFADVESALDLPYQKAFAELKRIQDKTKNDLKVDPAAMGAALLTGDFAKMLSQQVKAQSFSNAVRAAIEINLVNAQTGQLPGTLPAGLAKDLFSVKDFEYEITDDGFILRCQGKDLEKDEVYQYEFKIK